MSEVTLLHNPRCSKSRAALALLQQRGVSLRVVEYLQTQWTVEALQDVLRKLGVEAEALVRRSEDVFKSTYAGRKLTEAQWIEAMIQHPVLIERPIVINGNRAVIARPPERSLEVLGT